MKITKETFRKATGKDHFYLGFSAEEIQDLKKLSALPFCVFSQVKSGKDSWQGIYWTATNFSYFEMIESTSPGQRQLGVAVSANAIQYTDVRGIKKFYRGAKSLNSLIRKMGPSKKWFEAISRGPKENVGIFFWAMHYFFMPIENVPVQKQEPSVVDRFTDLEIRVSPTFLKELDGDSSWAPFERRGTKKKFVLKFLNKDRSELRIHCSVNPEVQHTEFVSLRGHASPFRKRLPKLKNFTLNYEDEMIVFKRKTKT